VLSSNAFNLARIGRNVRDILQWIFLIALVAIISGSSSAAFIDSLNWATAKRLSDPRFLLGLPLAGAAVAWVYQHWGKNIESGTNLLIEQVHEPNSIIPFRMAPFIFVASVASHLFGASVGREGGAVQISGTLCDQLSHLFKLPRSTRRLLLMAGMSAGFSSIFGTPLAGMVFGLEVLAVGGLQYDGLLYCLFASLLAKGVTLAWGIHYEAYPAISGCRDLMDIYTLLKLVALGVIFGSLARLFISSVHKLTQVVKQFIKNPVFRPIIGGFFIITLIWDSSRELYVGLSFPQLYDALLGTGDHDAVIWKFLLTVLSLSFGFKGGEVLSLFFLGAAMGNTASEWLNIDPQLGAHLGFISVFGAAANTPITAVIIAFELFGGAFGTYAAVAATVAYIVSSHRGIYVTQRVLVRKLGRQ